MHQHLPLSISEDILYGLTSILPNSCGVDVIEIDLTAHARPNLKNHLLYQSEILLTGKMSAKRLSDFTSGRLSAKKSLFEIGVCDFPILIDSNRAPLWPTGVVGSISHSKNICISAVNSNKNCKALGIDIESTEMLNSEVLHLICNDTEIAHLENIKKTVQGEILDNAKIIFSIKESIFKCLNPLLGCWIDFKEMQVNLNFDNNSYLATPLSENATLSNIKPITGNWYSNDYFHITSCWI